MAFLSKAFWIYTTTRYVTLHSTTPGGWTSQNLKSVNPFRSSSTVEQAAVKDLGTDIVVSRFDLANRLRRCHARFF